MNDQLKTFHKHQLLDLFVAILMKKCPTIEERKN